MTGGVDDPDLIIAMRLLDTLKRQGFICRRVGPGEDAPLWCQRVVGDFSDDVLIGGFSRDCYASRQRNSKLVVVGGGRTVVEVEGSALTVLNTVLTWPVEA